MCVCVSKIIIHCALSLAAQCIVTGPVCLQRAGRRAVGVSWWVCYLDNSKLVRGSAAGRKFFGSGLLQPARSICVFLSAF